MSAPVPEPAPSPAPTADAASSASCLGKAGLSFDDEDCDACMGDDAMCCQRTITCFDEVPECAALHACLSACGAAGTRDGGGGGGGDGGGTGAGCRDVCRTKHAAGLPAWEAYHGCLTKICGAQCL